MLAQFRAAQDFAAATDAEAEFRKWVIDAGYTWRAVFEPIDLRFRYRCRARRMLEELKIL